MRIYNTDQEKSELKQIASLLPKRKILNPNGAIVSIQEAYGLIDKSAGVVATEYQNHVGKGVYDEICYALQEATHDFVLASKKKLVAVLRGDRLFRVYSEHQIEVLDISAGVAVSNFPDWQVHYARVYEGFYITPLKERLTVERIKAKALHPGVGILNDVASTTKEFLIRYGYLRY